MFVLNPGSDFRAREPYEWMICGLHEVERDLKRTNIPFMLLLGNPQERLASCMQHLNPEAVYFDGGFNKGSQKLQQAISKLAKCSVYTVDTYNLVPERVTTAEEVGWSELSSKIHKQLGGWATLPEKVQQHPYPWTGTVMSLEELSSRIGGLLNRLPPNGQSLQKLYPSGEAAARKYLKNFIASELGLYANKSSDSTGEELLGLSLYLHFGQLSSLRVYIEVTAAAKVDSSLQSGADDLIGEMIVPKWIKR